MSDYDAPAWARESAVLRLGGDASGVKITPDWAFAGSTGRGVRVALIDSGIDADHPMLGNCIDAAGSIDLSVRDDGSVGSEVGPHGDVFGHGTACAGIIHAMAPEVRITSVRVLGPSLTGTAAAFHAGLAWAVDEGFDVINLSLGTSKKDWALAFHEVCDRAYFGGSFIVTAANNVARVSYPSLFASVASVACNTSADALRFHANPEPPTEFLARGIDVEVPWLDGGTTTTTGNSFAAPHIAGLAALVKAKHPELRPFQIKSVLWATAANVIESSELEAAGRRGTMATTGGRGTAMALVRPSVVREAPEPSEDTSATIGSRRRTMATSDATRGTERQRVDGFTIDEVVGHWRWGAIRSGRRAADSASVLIRELGGSLSDAELLERADRRVTMLAHPHLAPSLGHLIQPPAVVSRRPFPIDHQDRGEALAVCLAATAGLAAAHRAGLVHGDLDPSWLAVALDGRLTVGGIGVAAVVGAPTTAAARALHPTALTHLAPELLGDGTPETAADVFALGLLWSEALTGRLPWPSADTLGAFLRQRLSTPPAPIAGLDPSLPAPLTALIDASLSADPDDRPPDAGAFLSSALAGLGDMEGTAAAFTSPLLDRRTLGA